ncbi:MAG: DUF3426 domain-containing protein [Comamonadaceae bacterium]|nr:MAG: DUF3426 domain-containing protein [Comamonadaceae bacterium]
MSLITRCPACATTFKVVRDQLRISDGWVRCGRCGEVFDATLDLRDTDEAVPASAAEASQPAVSEPSIEEAFDHGADAWKGASPVSVAVPSDPVPGPFGPAPREEPWLSDEPVRARSAASPGSEPRLDRPDDGEAARAPNIAAPAPAIDHSTRPDPSDDPDSLTREPAGFSMLGPRFGSMDTSTDVVAPGRPKWWSRQPSLDMPSAATPRARFGSGEFDPVPVPSMPDGVPPPAPSATSALIQQAVDAQLQKALRRARIVEAREARLRARLPGAPDAPTDEVETDEADLDAPVNADRDLPIVQRAAADAVIERELPEESLPGFLEPATRRARRPLGRVARTGWSLIALLLLAALLLQVGRGERDLIAATAPALRPALETLCRWTGCELSPVRQIASIRIEGASFLRERDGYQLSFTLRNASALPLAMPAVELILLDTQERPVVRRVLLPRDFNAPVVIAARSDREAALSLGWTARDAASMPRVVGYRIDAFYP